MDDKTFLEYIQEAMPPDEDIGDQLVERFLEGTDRSTNCARHLDLVAGLVNRPCAKALREGNRPHDLPKIALLDDLYIEDSIQQRHRPGPLDAFELYRLLEKQVS
jgi:hypothetical protein